MDAEKMHAEPVKYVTTLTERALLVEFRVPLPGSDPVPFAINNRDRLNAVFAAAAALVEQELHALCAETEA
jgi:hypothetical protein